MLLFLPSFQHVGMLLLCIYIHNLKCTLRSRLEKKNGSKMYGFFLQQLDVEPNQCTTVNMSFL